MPRTARASRGGICDHVLNRGNARRHAFPKADHYTAFVKSLGHDDGQVPTRAHTFCLILNHFHLAADRPAAAAATNGRAAGGSVM